MSQPTATYQLLEAKLGTNLAQHIVAELEAGKSWQQIRDDLVADTGVRVTPQSLRNWFPELASKRQQVVGAA